MTSNKRTADEVGQGARTSLLERLTAISVATCSCGRSGSDPAIHAYDCVFRLLSEARVALESDALPMQPPLSDRIESAIWQVTGQKDITHGPLSLRALLVDAIASRSPTLASPSVMADTIDPLDWPIPCDLVDEAVTLRQGVKLRTVLTRLKFLSRLCRANLPKAYQYDVEHPTDGFNADNAPGTERLQERVIIDALQNIIQKKPRAFLNDCEMVYQVTEGEVIEFARSLAPYLLPGELIALHERQPSGTLSLGAVLALLGEQTRYGDNDWAATSDPEFGARPEGEYIVLNDALQALIRHSTSEPNTNDHGHDQEHTQTELQGDTKDAQDDASGSSRGRGAGAHEHNEHREAEPDRYGRHGSENRAGAGVSDRGEVREALISLGGQAPSMEDVPRRRPSDQLVFTTREELRHHLATAYKYGAAQKGGLDLDIRSDEAATSLLQRSTLGRAASFDDWLKRPFAWPIPSSTEYAEQNGYAVTAGWKGGWDECCKFVLSALPTVPSGQDAVNMLCDAMHSADVPVDLRAPVVGFFCNEWNGHLARRYAQVNNDQQEAK